MLTHVRLVEAAFTTLESGATLENGADLAPFAWYAGAYQQYHTVLLLLTERYKDPLFPNSERISTIINHIFGHCYDVDLTKRCGDILWKIKEGLESFYELRRVTSTHQVESGMHENQDIENVESTQSDEVQATLSRRELEESHFSVAKDGYCAPQEAPTFAMQQSGDWIDNLDTRNYFLQAFRNENSVNAGGIDTSIDPQWVSQDHPNISSDKLT